MNTVAEIREQYKRAVRDYFRQSCGKESAFKHPQFYEGRMSGLEVALDVLGVGKDEVREMYEQCKEETMDELAQEVYEG